MLSVCGTGHPDELFDVFHGDNAETTTPAVMPSRLFVDGRSECFAEELRWPTKRVSCMSEKEVEYHHVKEFERAGWDAVSIGPA